MTPRSLKLLSVAQAAARTSTHSQARIGAVVANGRDIIGVGVNGNKSHPLQARYNRFRFTDERATHLMHAELDAIVKAKASLSCDSIIYVYREMKSGQPGICRPCAGCVQALRDFNITRMFYTTSDGVAYEELNGFRRMI